MQRVKSGKNLANTLKVQKSQYNHLQSPNKGLEYNSQESLLNKKLCNIPRDISPAMKEYHSTRKFSPVLETKKLLNIENFFLEKYKILNSILHKKTLPVLEFYPNIDKKVINEAKVEKFLSPGPFKRKLSREDKEIERIIQMERVKELEEIEKGKRDQVVFVTKSRKLKKFGEGLEANRLHGKLRNGLCFSP